MKTRTRLFLAVSTAALGVVSAAALADPAPANARVTDIVVKQPSEYRQDGDRFKRVGPLPAGAVPVPARVLSQSKKGYVEVQGAAGPVWLDKMDVKLDPPASLWSEAKCSRQVTSQHKIKTHVGMGAGEECSS